MLKFLIKLIKLNCFQWEVEMKKFLAVATSLLLVFTTVACDTNDGNTDKDPSEDQNIEETDDISGDITFLTHRTDLDTNGRYDELIAQFQETYPDVNVEVQAITDYADELAVRTQTEEYGDVLMIPDAIPAEEFHNYLEPFGTIDDLSDKYTEDYLYVKWFDDLVYGLPSRINVSGIVYNIPVWEEAGIEELPASPEEFLDDLRLIQENTDAIPYYTNANSGWTLDQWEEHTGGSITGDPDYRNNILPHDKEAFAETGSHYVVSKLLYDIVDQGLSEEDPSTGDWERSKVMLNEGEIGSMLLGLWALDQIKEAGPNPDDVGYMPFPYNIDGERYASSGPDYAYGVNVHSENKDAAKAFVKFMIEESNLAVDEGGISIVKADPLPSGLENYEDVTLVVDKPATEENIGLLDDVQYESGITLYDNGSRMGGVVDIARGASSQTFEEYMQELTDNWAGAVEKVEAEQ